MGCILLNRFLKTQNYKSLSDLSNFTNLKLKNMTLLPDKQLLSRICQTAGKKIMAIYNDRDLFQNVSIKSDNSPLTLADKASHEIIEHELRQNYPDIPIISEEGKDTPFDIRKNYSVFWLVDPLDGTKEFINRNDEFTVNIALIIDQYPVAGFIYAPVTDVLYIAVNGVASKVEKGQETILKVRQNSGNRIAVGSRSHASEEEKLVLKAYNVTETISRGSSFKFCMIAEGMADIYYRHGPTMEWDTAAGQAILEAAGGHVFKENKTKERFSYNKETLLNSGFLCLGFNP